MTNYEQLKIAGDTVSITAIISSWLGVFSAGMTVVATLLAAIWSGIRIYETDTVQRWLKRRRRNRV